MKRIAILNHKGGVGKTTIATNLASYFAVNHFKVVLADSDVQQSSSNWLKLRPTNAVKIDGYDFTSAPPKNADYMIIDSPSGIDEDSLEKIVKHSDKIILPIKPSVFDMLATKSFLNSLYDLVQSLNKGPEICLVASMTDTRTKSTEQLSKFISEIKDELNIDCLAYIRQSQVYVYLAAYGFSIFDSKDSKNNVFSKEYEQWEKLIKWIES